MALYIKARKEEAQRLIKRLKLQGKLDCNFKVFQKEGRIWIPVRQGVEGAEEIGGREIRRRPRSIAEALAARIGKRDLDRVVDSFDIIGDIAIIEVPEGMEKLEKEVAQALMEVHRNVRVVLKKAGPMEGEYRTRKLDWVMGERRTETEHRENGARMLLDVSRVYFSPRLSHERKRIAGLVQNGERILALFAGVGPFPLVIAKKKKCEIVAIELNPSGADYMKRNIALNKLSGITALCGDVSEIVPKNYPNWAERVLMPLPKDAEQFLSAAYEGAADGAIVHFYCFVDARRPFEAAREKIAAHLLPNQYEIVCQRIVRPFSPALVQVVVDFVVRKSPKNAGKKG